MKIVLLGILTEIEDAQRIAAITGRHVKYIHLNQEEAEEFKEAYRREYPNDADEMFKGTTFWKGTEIKVSNK